MVLGGFTAFGAHQAAAEEEGPWSDEPSLVVFPVVRGLGFEEDNPTGRHDERQVACVRRLDVVEEGEKQGSATEGIVVKGGNKVQWSSSEDAGGGRLGVVERTFGQSPDCESFTTLSTDSLCPVVLEAKA